jgi:hypothetical protein
MKMSKYFRRVFKQAIKEGKKIISQFDIYNNEWQVSIEGESGVVITFNFNGLDWEFTDSYVIDAADLVITANSHGVAVLNGDGTATFTPTTSYSGDAGFTFTFLDGADLVTKNSCGAVVAGETTVNPFYFIDLINQELSTLLESNSILISGINIPVPISIVGGEYSINGGSWTSVSGSVSNGDTVEVRTTSSASYSTMVSATLTVSGYSDSFDVTTKTPSDPNPFYFTDVTGAAISTLLLSNIVTISGLGASASIAITGGEYRINGGAWATSAGTVVNTDTVQVRNTSSASYFTAVNATVTVGGYSDTYTITTRGEDYVLFPVNEDAGGGTGTVTVHLRNASNVDTFVTQNVTFHYVINLTPTLALSGNRTLLAGNSQILLDTYDNTTYTYVNTVITAITPSTVDGHNIS